MPSQSLDSLCYDIRELILLQLSQDRNAMQSCALLGRQWCIHTREHLFHCITLFKHSNRAAKFHRLLLSDPTIVDHVRELNVDVRSDHHLLTSIFRRLQKANLQKIRVYIHHATWAQQSALTIALGGLLYNARELEILFSYYTMRPVEDYRRFLSSFCAYRMPNLHNLIFNDGRWFSFDDMTSHDGCQLISTPTLCRSNRRLRLDSFRFQHLTADYARKAQEFLHSESSPFDITSLHDLQCWIPLDDDASGVLHCDVIQNIITRTAYHLRTLQLTLPSFDDVLPIEVMPPIKSLVDIDDKGRSLSISLSECSALQSIEIQTSSICSTILNEFILHIFESIPPVDSMRRLILHYRLDSRLPGYDSLCVFGAAFAQSKCFPYLDSFIIYLDVAPDAGDVDIALASFRGLARVALREWDERNNLSVELEPIRTHWLHDKTL